MALARRATRLKNCSTYISICTQTDRHTSRQTDRQNADDDDDDDDDGSGHGFLAYA